MLSVDDDIRHHQMRNRQSRDKIRAWLDKQRATNNDTQLREVDEILRDYDIGHKPVVDDEVDGNKENADAESRLAFFDAVKLKVDSINATRYELPGHTRHLHLQLPQVGDAVDDAEVDASSVLESDVSMTLTPPLGLLRMSMRPPLHDLDRDLVQSPVKSPIPRHPSVSISPITSAKDSNFLLQRVDTQEAEITRLRAQLTSQNNETRLAQDALRRLQLTVEQLTKLRQNELRRLEQMDKTHHEQRRVLELEIDRLERRNREEIVRLESLHHEREQSLSQSERNADGLKLQLLLYRKQIVQLQDHNDRLRFINSYTKEFFRSEYDKYRAYLVQLNGMIHADASAFEDEDGTTTRLINGSFEDATAEVLDPFSVEKMMSAVVSTPDRQPRLTKYIWMVIFINRVRTIVRRNKRVYETVDSVRQSLT